MRLPYILVRHRLTLVGAFCVLSLGISISRPALSSSSSPKTGCAQSVPFIPLTRSRFSSQSVTNTIRMEGCENTVPSIVVDVTVPNRDAGKKLARSIVEEKLAACVNIVPGIESVYQCQGEIQSDFEELLINQDSFLRKS